jgi:hypothetical protein
MNLIEQQNILRGLADDALKGEMGGGSVPPYLVLAEVNRRKSARERYEAANAKYRANQPTVAEELMGQKMPSGIDAAMPGGGMMPMGGMMQGGGGMPTAGIDAAMPQPQQAFANGGMVGYAEGGPVGYADGGIADLVSAYSQRLSGFDDDRKTAQKMALMNIGAQIMAGRSRNTLSNVGTGLSAALPSYQQSMERLNTQEMQAMRDQIDLARQMQQEDPAFRQTQTRQQLINAGFDPEDPNFKYYLTGTSPPAGSRENIPDIVQTYEYYVADEKAAGRVPKTFEQYAAAVKGGGGAGAGVTYNPDGSISINPGKLTEQQSNIMTYVNKGYSSAPTLDQFDQSLTNPTPSLIKTFGGDVGRFASNYFKSPDYRRAEQAGREFVAALLRRESGAAVTESEFSNYKETYLPIPGDDALVIDQKARSRANALLGLELGLSPDQIEYLHSKGIRADEYAKGVLNRDPVVIDAITQKSDAANKLGIAPASPVAPPDPTAAPAPEGIDPAVWAEMTDAERALWLN